MSEPQPWPALHGRALSIEPAARLEFGAGAVRLLPEAVGLVERHRVLVVTDPGLRAAGVLPGVLAVLGGAGLQVEVFDGVRANPTTTDVDAGGARARAFDDAAVVALGGGSAMDCAKGIALLATNPELTAADLDYRRAVPLPGLPLIAVPTTAGTGAETNGFGVIEDVERQCKLYVGHASVQPRVCVLDPELTVGLPRAVTAAAGYDALVHGIESLASRGASPVSVAYATQAVSMVTRWLPAAVADGTDLEARGQLLLAAHLAGRALTLSGLGLVHGIAHALTNHFHTVHGVALAAVLPEVMAFCADAAAGPYAVAARAMGARDAAAAAHDLAVAIGVRRPLRDLGLTEQTLDSVARGAIEDVVTVNSPRAPTLIDVQDILRQAL